MPKQSQVHIKDINEQLQAWAKAGTKEKDQLAQVDRWLDAATPYIIQWADDIGGIRNTAEKAAALTDFFKNGVMQLSAEDRTGFKDPLCDKLGIKSAQWNERMKLLTGGKKKEGADDEGEPIYVAGGWLFDHFFALEYDEELDETFFAVKFPDGRIEDRLERVIIQNRKYVPMPANNIIRKRVILLPSQMLDAEPTEEKLLFAIKVHNAKYFDFGADETFEQLCMIYPFFTYLARQFRTLPYLRALGDYGTGKSRLLDTVGPICFQPIMTNAGSSVSSLFRILDMFQGSTLVLDEADFGSSDEAAMISKIVNGGNEQGKSILRTEKNEAGNFDVAAFNVVGPKIFGMRQEFQDKASSSRCLTKEMLPIQPHPRIPLTLPSTEVYDRECIAIRNALHTYMMHNIQKSLEVDLNQIDRALDSRTAQVTVSLITVMKSEKGREQVIEYLKAVTEERKGERYATFTARVLEGLMLAYAWGPVSNRPEDLDRVYLKDIAAATNLVVDEQNKQMGEDDAGEDDSKKFKAKSRKLSHTMKTYLNLRTIRATDGIAQYKGTSYVNMAAEIERVKGLCERWAVEWREPGTVNRGGVEGASTQIDFTKSSPGLKKLSDEWRSMEPKEPSDQESEGE